jgi:hypothetical protein
LIQLQLLTAAVLIAVSLRETYLLVRNSDDLALRVLAPGLLCLAFVATAGISATALARTMVDLLGQSIYSTIINAGFMGMAYCFATFFVMADQRIPDQKRKQVAVRGLIVLTLAILIILVVHLTAPADVFSRPRDLADYKRWQHIVYDMTSDWCALVFWYLGVRRALRYMSTLHHRWLRWSLGIVIVGALAASVGVNVTALVIDTLHILLPIGPQHPQTFSALRSIYLAGLLGGQTTFAIGLVVPTLASGIVTAARRYERLAQSRYHRKMAPLWRTLTIEFPYVVLPASTETISGVDTPRRDDRFSRRTTEITDGLARLAPYYTFAGLDPERSTAGVSEPSAAAMIVHHALVARAEARQRSWSGDDARSAPPFPRLEPDFHGWRHKARWMVRLSRRLDQLTAASEVAEKSDAATARRL